MREEKRNTLYANLMDEVKLRVNCIDSAATGKMRFPNPIVREFCYLQLRMLCELISLSCLVAHGDITFLQPHKLGRSYSADEILDRLTKLRAHFYPIAVRQTILAGPPRSFQLEPVEPSPFSKDDLIKLYSETHKYLHRGSLKKLLSSETPIDVTINLPEIVKWAQRINDLLSSHVIAINSDRVILCILRNVDDNMRVQVVTAEKPPTVPLPPT